MNAPQLVQRSNTCLRHPQGASILLFREDYLAICDNSKPMAAVLSILDYLTSKASSDGKATWIPISQQELSIKAFGLFSRKTINIALQKLRDCNFLLSRVSNITSLNRVQEHWLDLERIQAAINAWIDVKAYADVNADESNVTFERVERYNAMGSADLHVRDLDSPYKEINTDDRVLSSLRGGQTTQSYHMVSDHVDDSHEMVGDPPEPFASWEDFEQYEKATAEIDAQQREYWKDKEVGEIFPVIHEEPPTSSAPPPPAMRKVNAHQTTVITPRDPIFDSVAKLQFGIDDTSAMPKGFGARIGRIVKVIVDAYKQRHNVTALSPNEREGLAGVHAKFWTWYTTVKYPSKGNEPPPQLRDAGKFAEYWLEYRTYRNAPRVEPVDVIPIARVGITTELPKPGGEWGVKHVR